MNLLTSNNQFNRKINRLQHYDYSQNGWYFVTTCAKDMTNFFGEVKNDAMVLNDYGSIAKQCWLDLPNHYKSCKLDEFIIMPNHIHGIIIIENNIVRNGLTPFHTIPSSVRNDLKPFPQAKQHGLSEIIRGFKTFSSRKIHETNPTHKFQWKKSFYDHVIRDEESLNNIREYIINNPLRWIIEKNNKENLYY